MKLIALTLAPVVLLLAGCGDSEPLPDIEASVEAMVEERAAEATLEAALIPTSTPALTQAPSGPTPAKDEIDESATCALNGGEFVQKGWSGKDTGVNYCNQCMCLNVGLACTKMACPPVKLPAAPR